MSLNPATPGLRSERAAGSRPIDFVTPAGYADWLAAQSAFCRNWLASQGFAGKGGQFALLPDESGHWQRVLAVLDGDHPYAVAHLPKLLPAGDYHRGGGDAIGAEALALGWGLGAYRFERYLERREPARLHAEGADAHGLALLAASTLVRDMVNTPAEDMGPEQLEQLVHAAASEFGARSEAVVGDALLERGFPTIHAVGRAAHRAPRLLRLDWGDESHPRVVLCGKGVCFDTGGLDLKPADGMRNMKKDMGGAAHALALARLVMQGKLPIRLTLLIAAVENSVAGNAFRPGDVIKTRQGLTVEIDNTDAEGRLVLCDALALAGELRPALIMDFATLTGAARIALGPDLPVLFSNRDDLAQAYLAAGEAQHDPLWRLPLWQPYLTYLKSNVADLANAGSRMAGSVTAALFLQRFVPADIAWTHVDVYSWNDSERPGKPAGGEAQGLRAAFTLLRQKYDNRHPASA